MKKIILSLLLLTAILSSYANTLQFNQVLNLSISSAVNNVYTVPSGKVWKIISATYSSFAYPVRINQINGNSTTLYLCGYEYGSNNIFHGVLPYWVPENTALTFTHGSSTGSYAFVSVIEFNVIP